MSERPAIVLVGGSGLGPWAWERVRPQLEAAGHCVVTPTLRATADDPTPAATVTLTDWVDDVVAALDPLDDAVLVAHSFAGYVAGGVLARSTEKLRTVVFLDAVLPQPDTTWFSAQGSEVEGYMRSIATDGTTTLFTRENLNEMYPDHGFSEADLNWLITNSTPQPFGTYEEAPVAATLEALAGSAVRLHYVRCLRTQPPYATISADTPGWTLATIDSSHWPMITHPDDTAACILDAV